MNSSLWTEDRSHLPKKVTNCILKKEVYFNVNVFGTKVLIEDTILTPPT